MSAEANTDGQSMHQVIYAYAFCCCSACTSTKSVKISNSGATSWWTYIPLLLTFFFFSHFSWFNFGFFSWEEMSPYYITICGFQIRMTILSSRSFVTHVQKTCLFTVSRKTCLICILWEKKVCNTDQINCKNSAWVIWSFNVK